MRVAEWSRRLAEWPGIGQAIAATDASSQWTSVAEEARPVLFASAYLANPRKTLIVAPTYDRCLKWQAKLAMCGVAESMIFQLPSGTSSLFDDAAPETIALSDRIGALRALTEDRPVVVIATPSAALERTIPGDLLRELCLELEPGAAITPDSLLKRLLRLGYSHQEPVRLPGQFSRRGGIVDVYPAGRELPVRIEFFGDEIESLRAFDPMNQRSVGAVRSVRLAPSRETVFPPEAADFRDMLVHAVEMEAQSLQPEAAARLREQIADDAEAIARRAYFDRLDLYRPLIFPDSGCAADLLGDDGRVVLDEPVELASLAEKAEEELAQALAARAERGEMLHSTALDFVLPFAHLGGFPHLLCMSSIDGLPEDLAASTRYEIGTASLAPFRGRPQDLGKAIQGWRGAGSTVVVCTDQPTRAKSVLANIDIFPFESTPTSEGEVPEAGVYLALGNLAGGFEIPGAKVVFLTDAELFGVGRLKLPQKRFHEGAPIATVLDLKPGDYVVHIQFGIGIYRGLVMRQAEGVEKEFLYIEYAAPDKLFVPADQLDRVQKYLNPSETPPKIHRLTGGDWQKTISKAREDARAFAQDLVKLYAERKLVQRRPHGPDTPWQGEMESTFPWVETPSQLAAIQDVKCDLTQPYPMDRLVCGDVGFGKTEVAIRAAFKVVQEGRQVALLCPTTILSEQHHRSFSERLEPFGVRLGLLNRFRSASERRKILEDLSDGKLDILIGTHSLLSKEIDFHDLGLVIIDEEQKFGVKQKEALKKLRVAVDVLSMSATPIPRTLSMAIMDIRQMSLINDPPPGRLPVRTFVRPYSKEIVLEAILRELARGGQVFYVYNRVQGIHHVAEALRKLVPTAKIAIGHGQMTESEIEPVMLGFIRGEIDVLLSTTIVESGLDIPNANTLIVENADRFGLAQLYQLRGRVGRSDRQAYAYFLYQSHKDVTDGGLQRLEALQEFSSLGSGYSLAFRDLQIRGAGELLGAKQHGAMASVGYELYTQLIHEQVQLLKSVADGTMSAREAAARDGDALKALEPLPTLDVSAPACIPDRYIRDQAQRLYYYQRMMSVRQAADLEEVRQEVLDRYGRLPQEVDNAFRVVRLRLLARDLGIDKIEAKGGRVAVWFANRSQIPPLVFSNIGKRKRDAYLTRDNLIWPYSGDAVGAVELFFKVFREEVAAVQAVRSALT